MKCTWFDSAHSKVIVELDEGEPFFDFLGPASIQIIAGSAEMAALEAMEPKPEIHDAPVREGAPAQHQPKAATHGTGAHGVQQAPKAGDKHPA
jgi:hypothetical protein